MVVGWFAGRLIVVCSGSWLVDKLVLLVSQLVGRLAALVVGRFDRLNLLLFCRSGFSGCQGPRTNDWTLLDISDVQAMC